MEDNFHKRIQFCEEMIHRIDKANFLNFLVFFLSTHFTFNISHLK